MFEKWLCAQSTHAIFAFDHYQACEAISDGTGLCRRMPHGGSREENNGIREGRKVKAPDYKARGLRWALRKCLVVSGVVGFFVTGTLGILTASQCLAMGLGVDFLFEPVGIFSQ